MSNNPGPNILTSPASVVSQISTIASLGSIIIGLLLVRQMSTEAADSCEEYVCYQILSQLRFLAFIDGLMILAHIPFAWHSSAVASGVLGNLTQSAICASRLGVSSISAFLSRFFGVTQTCALWQKNGNIPCLHLNHLLFQHGSKCQSHQTNRLRNNLVSHPGSRRVDHICTVGDEAPVLPRAYQR